jgi:hypothetical protein
MALQHNLRATRIRTVRPKWVRPNFLPHAQRWQKIKIIPLLTTNVQ